jgi:hypothetical protein
MAIQQKAIKDKIRQDKLKLEQVHTIVTKLSAIAYNEETDPFKDNPLYKFCKQCKKYKLIATDYYLTTATKTAQTMCKVCHNEKHRQKMRDFYDRKYRENGGSERIIPEVGKYVDQWQEEQTRWLLNVIGWKYSEETKTWWKPGIKDKHNNWVNVIPKPKAPKKEKPPKRIFDVDKMVELRNSGLLFREIGAIMGWSRPVVVKRWKIHTGEK